MADQTETKTIEEELVETGSSEDVTVEDPAETGSVESQTEKAASLKEDRDKALSNESAPRRNWFLRFLLCCLSFLIVSGLTALAFYVLGAEPFGTKTLTVDDAKIQYIDFFTYFVDVLQGTRSLSYDFANLLGGNSIGIFSYYLASPFNLLLYYFGKAQVYRFFDVAVILKLGTAGATFAWYLQRRFEDRIRPVFVLALSMGYGLMQYSVQQCSNIMWLDGVYMLPLIMLGVYEVLHKKSVWRLAFSVALCIFFNWYIAGVSCLFTGIWFIFEFFFQDETVRSAAARRTGTYGRGAYAGQSVSASSMRRRPGRWTVEFTDFFLSFCRYVWGMGLGVALSAILFLPVISAMRRGTGQYDEIKFVLKLSGDMLSAVRGYVIGTESAQGFAALFCGGIAISALAAFFFSGGFRIRQKIAMLFMAGICFLMLHWEPAILAFSLLKRADSYWYRYSYLICFVLLFGAGAYLSRAEQDRWTKFFVIAASLLYTAAVLKLNGIHPGDFRAQGLSLVRNHPALFTTAAASVILAVLMVIYLSCAKIRFVRIVVSILLLAVTGIELWGNARLIWQKNLDDSQTMYREYSEGMQTQLAQLRAVDDGYYRIAQDRMRWHYDDDLTAYFNDSLALGYWSNTSYTSSQDDRQISLMWRLGYRDEAGRMLIVRDPVLASDSFLGVKYLLQSTPIEGLEPVEGVEPFNGRTAYRNPFALPMAFVYDGAQLPTMRYDNTFVYQNELFSTLSGQETELYTPLSWTRHNEDNKAYFTVYIPRRAGESSYGTVAYGNLLWDSKKTGLMSINGSDPFGYCRWKSPACFLIRSREEQAQSGAGESLQGIAQAERDAEKQTEAEAAKAAGKAAPEESALSLEKKELAEAAAAYDKEVLATLDRNVYEDVRTVVFRSDEDLSFKDYEFYGLNLDALQETVERIRSEEVTDVTIENGHVTCNVDGAPGRSLCLLVPMAKGWEALRNGEAVQPNTVAGSMITIPLENGKNNIELTYHVPYVREGMYVSAAALAVVLLDALIRGVAAFRRRRR